MNKYDLLYIIDNDVDEDKKNDIIAKFSSLIEQNGGKVTALDKWGLRKYAYRINVNGAYKYEGFYVKMSFECDGGLIAELERQMRNNESIVRELVTAVEE
ncbi:MAG: 30S ribosomal protein S6 [Clostridia bacterium]|nr:30S ribosomal protein S6 [Clostridia bacterium]